MIVLEFCGPGGCGKTTVCDLVEAAFREQDLCVKNLQKRQRPQKTIEKMRLKARLFFRWFAPSNLRLGMAICWFAFLNQFIQPIRWANRIIELQDRLEHEREAELVVLDEGFVQFLSSLAYDRKIERGLDVPVHLLKNRVYVNGRDLVVIIRCGANEETTIARLINRHRKSDRNIHEDKRVMQALISRRCENIDQIIKRIAPSMTFFCPTEDQVEAVETIMQKVAPFIGKR